MQATKTMARRARCKKARERRAGRVRRQKAKMEGGSGRVVGAIYNYDNYLSDIDTQPESEYAFNDSESCCAELQEAVSRCDMTASESCVVVVFVTAWAVRMICPRTVVGCSRACPAFAFIAQYLPRHGVAVNGGLTVELGRNAVRGHGTYR